MFDLPGSSTGITVYAVAIFPVNSETIPKMFDGTSYRENRYSYKKHKEKIHDVTLGIHFQLELARSGPCPFHSVSTPERVVRLSSSSRYSLMFRYQDFSGFVLSPAADAATGSATVKSLCTKGEVAVEEAGGVHGDENVKIKRIRSGTSSIHHRSPVRPVRYSLAQRPFVRRIKKGIGDGEESGRSVTGGG